MGRRRDSGFSSGALLALALVSGASALVYETIWVRWFQLLFGNTANAASATLCAFFGGLALGAALFGRLAGRTSRPLHLYARIEAAAAVTALWVPLAIQFYDPLYASLYESLSAQRPVFVVVKLALALVALLPTTILLGGTLPMLAAALPGDRREVGRLTTRLYAVNTLGAALGAAIGALLFPEWIGVPGTYAVGILGTVGVAGGAFVLARGQRQKAPSIDAGKSPPRAPLSSLLISGASGFGVLAVEVLLIHSLSQLYSHNAYSFGMILLVALGSLAMSAAFVSITIRRFKTATLLRVAVLAQGLMLLLGPRAVLLSLGLDYAKMHALLDSLGLEHWWITIILVIRVGVPAFLFGGMVFPLTFRLASKQPTGSRVGGLLAANTIGGILGSVGAGFVFLGHIGLWTTIGWLGVLYAAAALLVPGGARARIASAAAFAAIVGLVLFSSYNPWRLPRVGLAAGERLLGIREGASGIVSVVESSDGTRRFKLDNRYEFGDSKSTRLYERSGHLPLLLHPDPRHVAFVGSATGGVAAAAVLHPVETIDLIEIVPEVQELAAEYFKASNRGVHHDPRTRLVMEDGRNHLRAARTHYDVVVEDLFVPYRPSAATMYSRDHYEEVRARLTENGIFCQWLPIYQLNERMLLIIAATFAEVFPGGTLWRTNVVPTVPMIGLVGSRGSMLTSAEIEGRAEMLEDMAIDDLWVTDPHDVWYLYVGAIEFLFEGRSRPRAHTDRRPSFEFVAARTAPGDLDRFRDEGWPRLAQSLADRAKEGDPVFPDRPLAPVLGANALLRANLAAVGKLMDLERALGEVERYVPMDTSKPTDPSFTNVWPK